MRKLLIFIPLFLIVALLASIVFWPGGTPVISIFLPVASISIALFITAQKHWQAYQKEECTREKMVRNLTLDILGFFLTMGAAMYAGGTAGKYIGLYFGLWIGLLAGFAGGFLAAWAVRLVWGKLVMARAG